MFVGEMTLDKMAKDEMVVGVMTVDLMNANEIFAK
jgi:hypothetical protein